jgi:hypothetical protein
MSRMRKRLSTKELKIQAQVIHEAEPLTLAMLVWLFTHRDSGLSPTRYLHRPGR